MRRNTTLLILGLFLLLCGQTNAALTGPTPYLQASDSPFAPGAFSTFYLEDFEDHLFNTPGVSATDVSGTVTSTRFGTSLMDSVDGDDGAIDGSGQGGDSYWANGSTGILLTFDASVLGTLPTHAGVVWTDGAGTTFFEAWDAGGTSLGTIGPVAIADGNHAGGTGEDRFFGAMHSGGISEIFISNSSGGIEIDHLQYGISGSTSNSTIPAPASMSLVMLGLAGIRYMRRKRSL